uniref:Uncharacterized protein n=1 Tax=Rhizophora mucronata TaxID=61149 RepID=A0A2P2PW48_RHIMU
MMPITDFPLIFDTRNDSLVMLLSHFL